MNKVKSIQWNTPQAFLFDFCVTNQPCTPWWALLFCSHCHENTKRWKWKIKSLFGITSPSPCSHSLCSQADSDVLCWSPGVSISWWSGAGGVLLHPCTDYMLVKSTKRGDGGWKVTGKKTAGWGWYFPVLEECLLILRVGERGKKLD